MKRFIAAILTTIMILSATVAFADMWYCPQCGRLNDQNFCPVDGTAKPVDVSPQTPARTLSELPDLAGIQTKMVASENVVVYTGPGTNYYRSASGKANVHHSAPVRAFGRDGDWVLIQYDAERGGKDITRFAYAPASVVANGWSLPELDFVPVPIRIAVGAHIVDEPSMDHYFTDFRNVDYQNAVALAKINTGGYLWIYFETTATSGQGFTPFRGFVRIQDVTER